MKLPTKKELEWRETDDKISPYLNGKDELKEGSPEWAKELYKKWKKQFEEVRAEMDEEKKKNGGFLF